MPAETPSGGWRDTEQVEWCLSRIGRLEARQAGEQMLADVLPAALVRVLDLGCGDGRLAAHVMQARPSVRSVVAIDRSPSMLDHARARFAGNTDVQIVEADIAHPLPRKGPFDAVVSGFAIHHLEHDRKQSLFGEVASVLAPDGLFANLEVVASASDRLHAEFLAAIGRDADDPEDRLAPIDDQLNWMRNAGLTDVDCVWRWRGFALLVGWRRLASMAQLVGAVCMSHAPFWDSRSFDPATGAFMAAAARARELVQAAAPDALVVIGPDHFRNFFYDAMPAFCLGVDRITSFGDFQTPAGDLPGAPALARWIHGAMRESFDIAVSLHMGVDHGIAQSYVCLVPALDVPLVPVMLACTGAARPSLARCRSFGAALGDTIRRAPGDARVVVVGSGGLSHWLPPTDPDHPAISAELRTFVVEGRPIAHEYQREREKALMAAAATLTGRVNAEWDEWFLGCVASNDLDGIGALTDSDIDEHAGNGGHEIRTWLVTLAAWGESIATLGYEPQPGWLTGTGVAASVP